jgi:hypothetical protein
MNGAFDSFQKPMRGESRDGGISPLDLAELPSLLRKIMRHILREREVTHAALCQWVAEMPELERPSPEDFSQALESLRQQSWLAISGEGDAACYQVNLRRKPPTKKTSQTVWDALDTKFLDSLDKK